MATSHSLLEFFTLMESQGGVVVKQAPKLDLDVYIQNYKGRTRLDRLIHIGRSSVVLCVDALKAAVNEARKGRDTEAYREAVELLHLVAPHEPEAALDTTWIANTNRTNKAEAARLEAELKGYKNNLIKESIRMGHEDLARHLEAMGDLAGAADYYVKMRPDLSSPKHFFEVGKRIVNLSLARRDYPMALVHVSKVLPHQVVEDEVQSRAYVAVVQGVASLCLEQYDNAVRAFLSVGSGAVGGASYAEVASPNDVAVFGGVLALATMERREMQASVLENANFRTYLELEPLLRKAISCYINGRYKYCLDILDTYKADLLLDIYMQKHVELLYSTIRNKCIVQFLIPYSVVTLELMNETFGRPGESIEDELAKMISRRELSARLNPIDRLVESVRTDNKVEMRRVALEAARTYEREASDRIRRMNIVGAELELRGGGRRGGPAGLDARLSALTDAWYDEARKQGGSAGAVLGQSQEV